MNGTLPAWIERLLGESPGPGEGTVWSLEHNWFWPPWLTLMFAVLATIAIVSIYLRDGRGAARPYRLMLAAMRLSLVAIVLLMIAQLAISLQRTGLPYVAVLVDDSLSMTIADRYDDKLRESLAARVASNVKNESPGNVPELSRWNLARTLLTERDGAMLKGLAENYKLRTYFLTGVRPSGENGVAGLIGEIGSLRPTGETSRLGAAVRGVLDDLRGAAPAAIVMLTDGINTDGPALDAAAASAQRQGVPLYLVGLGSDQPIRDLRLSDLMVDPLVFVDDVVNFEFQLTGTGFEGKKVRVELREQDKSDVLSELEVTVGPDGQPQQVRLPYRPTQVGQFRYVVEVEPQKDELQTENNRQQRTVEVRKEKIRVLLVQSYPSFEFRYLRNMLRRDETIELSTVLQEGDLEYTDQDASALRVFPVQRDALFAYDVVILGDVNPALLSAAMMQNLADFVDHPGKGGALVLIAGERFMPVAYRDTPLERLMPVELSSIRYPDPNVAITDGFQVRPTELGLASPGMQLGDTPAETRTIWQNLPPVYWMAEMPDRKPAVRVLAEHPTLRDHEGRPLPVICMQYVGAGKVLFHATDETWRWRRRVGDAFFARYWIQTIRYLSRSKLAGQNRAAALSVDRPQYAQGEPVQLRLQFTDPRLAPPEDNGVTIVVEHQGHKTQRIELHRGTSGQGVFTATLERPAVGSYHAWVAIPTLEGTAPAVDFTVVAPPGEFERVRMDADAMQQAARQTKGRYYTFATAGRLLRDLPPGRQVPIESLPPRPLWNRWPVVLLFLGLLIGEWILRKLGGMV